VVAWGVGLVREKAHVSIVQSEIEMIPTRVASTAKAHSAVVEVIGECFEGKSER
jgi:hypothetical protein